MNIEDREQLIKFLNGNATVEEIGKVQALLQQPDAQQLIEELTWQEWNEPIANDKELDATIKNWKENINSRIAMELPENKKIVHQKIILKKMQFFRYAAIWTILFLAGGLAVWHFNKDVQKANLALVYRTNTLGLPQKYVLPDSSVVYLGAGSQLHYPVRFSGKNREVDLQGEAFFEVKHQIEQPFIIHTAEINTQVLGTSFQIRAFADQPISVAVATGKVGITKNNGKAAKTLAMLTPGMKVTWNRPTQQAIQATIDPNSLEQWKAGDLVFEEQTLAQIATELQRRFGVKIDFINKEVAHNQVSGTFPASKSIAKIMKPLALAGKFRYETINNQSFKIYKIN